MERREVFLSLSEVRSLLDMRVLEGRGAISVHLIESCWTSSSLGDAWMLEMPMLLTDEEDILLLGTLVLSKNKSKWGHERKE